MSARFPSRYELKIAGCSLICAQFLLVLLGIIYAIIDPQDYDASIYSARTDEDVVKLHEVLSSEDIRTSTEISAAIWWMSFPFYLIALYVIKKLFMSFFIGTKVEMWIYVMEKAYLFAILITNIIGPALSLTVVSFEWSIHEYTPDTEDYVPTFMPSSIHKIMTLPFIQHRRMKMWLHFTRSFHQMISGSPLRSVQLYGG
eukprot:693984_1